MPSLALCPQCSRELKPLARPVVLPVPIGETRAPYHGPGEVVSRGRLFAGEVDGRPAVMQECRVWDGERYASPWLPFCSDTCAGRFGVKAWHAGVRLPEHEAPALPAPEPARLEPAAVADRFAALLEHVAEPEAPEPQPGGWARLSRDVFGAEPAPEPAPIVAEPERHASGRKVRSDKGKARPPKLYIAPGEPGWHPPGKPPPVPGVFKYRRNGYRDADTPEARAAKEAQAARAREGKAAARERAERYHRQHGRTFGRLNGHLHGSRHDG